MDRVTTYTLALGRSTDFLTAQQDAMVGNAYTNQAFLGTSVQVDGLALAPTTPASMVLNLGLGAVYQLANLEATTWSVLPANTTTSIVKQGLLQSVDPITFAAPTTAGYAQNFLVEVQYADLDTTPVLLPFYNSATPSTPYQGPNNSGVSSNTARLGVVAVQVKAGTAATSGSQATPTPDPGWVGLYVVTVPAGATTLTSGSIALYPAAPFIPVKLPGVPAGVLSGAWVSGQSSAAGPVVGSPTAAQLLAANTYSATMFSTAAYPFALTAGMEVLVYFGQANTSTSPTLNLSGSGALPVLRQSGGAPQAANATYSIPADISGWMPLVLNNTKTAWLINGLAYSDLFGIIGLTSPTVLKGNATLYVDLATAKGNDATGTGTQAAPFASIQRAVGYASSTYYFSGYSVTIQLMTAGTYAAPYSLGSVPNLSVVGSSGAQANYVLTGSAAGFLFNPSGINCTLVGLTINLTGTGCGGASVSSGTLTMSYVSFTSSGQTCSNSLLSAGVAGILTIGNGCIINGCNPTALLSVANGGGITQTAAITLQGSITASNFITATNCGIYQTSASPEYINQTTANNITNRYNVSNNAVVSTNGGGATYFLGSGSGTTSTGGQYV